MTYKEVYEEADRVLKAHCGTLRSWNLLVDAETEKSCEPTLEWMIQIHHKGKPMDILSAPSGYGLIDKMNAELVPNGKGRLNEVGEVDACDAKSPYDRIDDALGTEGFGEFIRKESVKLGGSGHE